MGQPLLPSVQLVCSTKYPTPLGMNVHGHFQIKPWLQKYEYGRNEVRISDSCLRLRQYDVAQSFHSVEKASSCQAAKRDRTQQQNMSLLSSSFLKCPYHPVISDNICLCSGGACYCTAPSPMLSNWKKKKKKTAQQHPVYRRKALISALSTWSAIWKYLAHKKSYSSCFDLIMTWTFC